MSQWVHSKRWSKAHVVREPGKTLCGIKVVGQVAKAEPHIYNCRACLAKLGHKREGGRRRRFIDEAPLRAEERP